MSRENDHRKHHHHHERENDWRKNDEVNWEEFQNLVKRIMEKHPDLTREQAIKLARKHIAHKRQDRRDKAKDQKAHHGDEQHPHFKQLMKRLHEEFPDLSREELLAKAKQILRRKHAAHDGKRHDEEHPHFKQLVKRLHEEFPDLSREELLAKAKEILRRKHAARSGEKDTRAGDGETDERKGRRDRMHARVKELREQGYDPEQIRDLLRKEFKERHDGRDDGTDRID